MEIDLGLPAYVGKMTGDKSLSKAVNRGLLLDLVRKGGETSRAALAKASGLNKATVSSQIGELIAMGIVRETGMGDSGLGRKPILLRIAPEAGRALGLSIATGALHAVALDAAGGIVREEAVPLPDKAPPAAARAVAEVVARYASEAAGSRYGLVGVGIAVPGAVEKDTELVVRSAKLDWTAVDLRGALAASWPGRLHVGNDSTLATIAERELYASDARDLVCVVIDEGIGSGAYVNGTIHYGHNGRFGEVGHMTIQHGGKRCPCGNYGCWDLYGSELALREAIGRARGGPVPDQEETLALAAALPSWCEPAFDDFVGYLTSGVSSLVNAFAPSVVVVNCAVLEAAPRLFERLREGVLDRAMAHFPVCELRLSALGRSAPALGAAMAVQEMFYRNLVLEK